MSSLKDRVTSKPAPKSAAEGTAAPEGSRVPLLASAALAALAGAAAWQGYTAQEDHARQSVDRARDAAAVSAERVNTLIMQAWAALDSVSSLAASTGLARSDPSALAAAAARADAVAGVVVFNGEGRAETAAAPRIAAIARAALAEAGKAESWTGAAEDANGAAAPALVRRIGDRRVVSVLDVNALTAPDPTSLRVTLSDEAGRLLASAPAAAKDLNHIEALLGPDPVANGEAGAAMTGGRRGTDAALGRAAVGFADTAGGLRVHVARPIDAPVIKVVWAALVAGFMLGAPMAAAFVTARPMMRRAQQRAESAEEQLTQVQRHFRLAVDGARAGVWTWRRGPDRIELSQRLQRMLGVTEAALSGTRFIAMAVEEDRARLQAAFINAVESGALEVSFRVQGPKGLQWVELRGVAVEDQASDHEQVVVGTALDATPRREAELRSVAIERRLKAAVESFTGPFALFDHRRRLTAWNSAFASVFKLGETTLRAGARYGDVFAAADAFVRNEKRDPADPQTREIELNDGTWLQLVERATGEGGVVVVGVDISTLKAQAQELSAKERRMRKIIDDLELSEGREKELKKKYEIEKRRAEEASKAKTAFLANMSHELRTPLNAINGFSEVIAQQIFGPINNAKYAEYARDIQASGQLLLDMISDILDMAKIEAGKFNLNLKPIDPTLAIDQAVRLMRHRAQEKKLTLTVELDELPEITADFRALKQIILNLLSNALKFTVEGGVTIRGETRDDGISVKVIDTGPGIPPEAMNRIARPFEQVDAEFARAHPGTGLGLALTKTLAELHGGRFTIESAVGVGTTVGIFLPKTPPADFEDSQDARPQLLTPADT